MIDHISVAVRDLRTTRLGDSGKPLVLLFGAVALLLAIAVSNVAGPGMKTKPSTTAM